MDGPLQLLSEIAPETQVCHSYYRRKNVKDLKIFSTSMYHNSQTEGFEPFYSATIGSVVTTNNTEVVMLQTGKASHL